MNEELQELAKSYLVPTTREQIVVLTFMVKDARYFLMKRQGWEQLFDGERLGLFQAINKCISQVTATQIKYHLSKMTNDKQQLETYWNLYQKMLATADKHLEAESFEGTLKILQDEYIRKILLEQAMGIYAYASQSDPKELANQVKQALVRADPERPQMSVFLDEVESEERMERFIKKSQSKIFSTGIDELDDDLGGGFTYGDFVILVAPTGSGKSFFLTQLGYFGLLQSAVVVLVQGEMTLDQSDLRLDTRLAGIKYGDLRQGKITEAEKSKWRSSLANLRSRMSNLYTITLDDRNFTVATIHNELESLRAKGIIVDIVLVDYLLLMKPSTSSKQASQQENLTACARELNDLSNHYKRGPGEEPGVVVVSVSQAKPDIRTRISTIEEAKNLSVEELTAYSRGINNFANNVYGLVPASELDEVLGRRVMVCLKNRWGESGTAYLIDTRFDLAAFHHPKMIAADQIKITTEDESSDDGKMGYT